MFSLHWLVYYFSKDNLTKIATIEDLIEKLKEIKGQPNINSIEKYTLNLDPAFDDFILKENRNSAKYS